MSLCSKRRGEGGGPQFWDGLRISQTEPGVGLGFGAVRAEGVAASPELSQEAPGDWGGGGSRS